MVDNSYAKFLKRYVMQPKLMCCGDNLFSFKAIFDWLCSLELILYIVILRCKLMVSWFDRSSTNIGDVTTRLIIK